MYITSLKWQNYRNRKKISCYHGLRMEREGGCGYLKGDMKKPFGDGAVTYLDCGDDDAKLHM